MASLLLDPLIQALDSNGDPLSGAKLEIFDAGTTTDADVYTDNALTIQHPQPVVADSAGRFANIYTPSGQLYKIVLKDSADAEIVTVDNITPYIASDGGTLPVTGGGTGATTAAAARTNLGAAAQSDFTALNATVSTIDGELSGIGGSLGSLAAQDTLDATDFGTDLANVVVQEVRASTNTQSTLSSALIPGDATIPQDTEGVEFLTLDITPKRTDTIMRVRGYTVLEQASSATVGVVAAFVDASSNALNVVTGRMETSNPQTFTIEAEYDPSTLVQRTFSLRAGCIVSRNMSLNTTLFGGAVVSELIVQEIYTPS